MIRIRVKVFFYGVFCIDLMDLVAGNEINISLNKTLSWVQSAPQFQFAKTLKLFVFLIIILVKQRLKFFFLKNIFLLMWRQSF